MNIKLNNPPNDERDRELWLQHAAGVILFEDVRNYAIMQIAIDTDESTKEKVIKGIDDAIYGLMMIMDGVAGTLQNDEYKVSFENNILLERNGKTLQKINTLTGDGMCMGFHGWKEGDFGEDDVYTIVP